MASIPELLDGHVTLEVECLDRLYLNGYIGSLATSGGLITFMREQLGKPIPSPVVLGQVTEKFREAVKAMTEREQIPLYQFDHKERKDDIANDFRRKRGVRDKGLIFRPPRTNRYFVTPYGWKVARLFSRLEARVFRPAVAMFTGNDAVLPFPLRASLDRVDAQLDELIYQAFPQIKAA